MPVQLLASSGFARFGPPEVVAVNGLSAVRAKRLLEGV